MISVPELEETLRGAKLPKHFIELGERIVGLFEKAEREGGGRG